MLKALLKHKLHAADSVGRGVGGSAQLLQIPTNTAHPELKIPFLQPPTKVAEATLMGAGLLVTLVIGIALASVVSAYISLKTFEQKKDKENAKKAARQLSNALGQLNEGIKSELMRLGVPVGTALSNTANRITADLNKKLDEFNAHKRNPLPSDTLFRELGKIITSHLGKEAKKYPGINATAPFHRKENCVLEHVVVSLSPVDENGEFKVTIRGTVLRTTDGFINYSELAKAVSKIRVSHYGEEKAIVAREESNHGSATVTFEFSVAPGSLVEYQTNGECQVGVGTLKAVPRPGVTPSGEIITPQLY